MAGIHIVYSLFYFENFCLLDKGMSRTMKRISFELGTLLLEG